MSRSECRVCFAFVALLAAALAFDRMVLPQRMTLVVTESVPRGLYALRPFEEESARVGQLVCLRANGPDAPRVLREGLAQGRWPASWSLFPFVKRIAAREGARVTAAADGLRVDGATLAHSQRRVSDTRGRALPSPAFPLELGADEVWLSSDVDSGFDSRYFGPAKTAALDCIAEPLWTL
ncbi:MAG TPA: S26 family signal peptidase [Polyangiales bacterium]|nr:S26 family signal peptidase [Polyangiales bacterium]